MNLISLQISVNFKEMIQRAGFVIFDALSQRNKYVEIINYAEDFRQICEVHPTQSHSD